MAHDPELEKAADRLERAFAALRSDLHDMRQRGEIQQARELVAELAAGLLVRGIQRFGAHETNGPPRT